MWNALWVWTTLIQRAALLLIKADSTGLFLNRRSTWPEHTACKSHGEVLQLALMLARDTGVKNKVMRAEGSVLIGAEDGWDVWGANQDIPKRLGGEMYIMSFGLSFRPEVLYAGEPFLISSPSEELCKF